MTEFTITSLGLHGDGIADGPIFAPMTLPGEVVQGDADGDHLTNIKIIVPSPDRVAPPCRHFKSCGGCSLQHARDELVAEWKVNVVRQALLARGLETDFRPIITSPPFARRRASFAARRTKKGAMVGFHGRASGTIVEIPGCQLLQPDVLKGTEVARELAIMGASRKAALAVTVTSSDAGLDVAVRHGKPLDGPLRQQLAQICPQLGLARLTWEDEVIAMSAPPGQDLGGTRVVPPPGAFLQATADGQATLIASVQEIMAGARCVADLFSGCGTFSLPLARDAEVWALEGDRSMIEVLDKGWRYASGLKTITSETRDLFRRPVLPDELRKTDGVVLDPPRAGAEAQVAELARCAIPRIAYVSCNPVTFARDAETLVSAGYRLNWIQVVDQFRWSPHVELAASFSRP